MNRPYIAFYKDKKVEVYATSSYAAQQEAAKQLKVPDKKRYQHNAFNYCFIGVNP